MRRFVILFPLLMLAAACSEEAEQILDPVAANSLTQTPNAIVNVDGVDYKIGCPDFPCPVTPLVLDHISKKLYFWLPANTLAKPAIYLYVLRVPVQLDVVPTPTVVTPPVLPPEPLPPTLVGPGVMTSSGVGPLGQVICSNVPLALNIPDNGTWDFVSGEIFYEYVTWNTGTGQWDLTGQTSVIPFGQTIWTRMLQGIFSFVPPVANSDYYVTVTADLQQGSFEATVSHRLLCARPGQPPVVPPAPSLDGPTEYIGTRPVPAVGNLVCSLVGVTLISPDGGPWDFVSGSRLIEFMRFDSPTQSFVLNGQTRTDPLSAADWQALLNGTHTVDPVVKSGPYFFTFSVLVERGQYQHTITHRAVCGGKDYFDTQRPTVATVTAK